jgi:glycosyltransferase involved in cell wall biosynthesis
VSVLAYGISMPKTHATGIFRVVRELLLQIARRRDLDARLICSESGFDEAEIAGYLDAQAHPLRGRLERVWPSRLSWPQTWQAVLHRAVRTESPTLSGRLRRRLHRSFVDRTTARRDLAGSMDVYHSLWNELPARTGLDARARLLTVYDLIPILAPDAFPPIVVDRFTRKIRSVDTRRDWVLCISENTKRDFCAYTSMDPARVFVMPLAASDDVFHPHTEPARMTAIRAKYGIRTPRYVLSLSTVHRRKGSLQIARSFGQLVRSGELADASLVFVGPELLPRADILGASGLGRSLEHRIVTCGHVPDADLAAVYSGARVCVYLSAYEGFGLPPLEAMQCGVPVIASDTSSVPEVVGNAGIMVNPDDDAAIGAHLARLWHDDDLHRCLVERGRSNALRFSWERSVQTMLDVYGRVLGRA